MLHWGMAVIANHSNTRQASISKNSKNSLHLSIVSLKLPSSRHFTEYIVVGFLIVYLVFVLTSFRLLD